MDEKKGIKLIDTKTRKEIWIPGPVPGERMILTPEKIQSMMNLESVKKTTTKKKTVKKPGKLVAMTTKKRLKK